MEGAGPRRLDAVRHFYEAYDEDTRLDTGPFRLERARTEILLRAWLPRPPAVVLDVGGGPGVYACALAMRGYTVHLLDLVPRLVGQAAARSRAQPDHPLASVRVGDARALSVPDACADAVLLLGPLYHLHDAGDRGRALAEARRALRPGGRLVAAGISRYASMLDGFLYGSIDDERFAAIVDRDLSSGRHHNPTDDPAWFTDAFFHEPERLARELEEAGFDEVTLRAVEGVGWLVPDFDRRWADPALREALLAWIARTDAEPSLLGASAHLLAAGRKPENPDGRGPAAPGATP